MAQVDLARSKISTLPTPPAKVVFIYRDTTIKGLAVIAHPSGKKVYRYYYKMYDGKRRALTLGDAMKMSYPNAVKLVFEAEAKVKDHIDPMLSRKRILSSLGEVVELYSKWDNTRSHKKKKKYLLMAVQAWGEKTPVLDIKRWDVAALHYKLGQGNGHVLANRWLSTMSVFFNFLIKIDVIEKNPTIGIIRFREKPRARVLTDEELSDLRSAISRESFKDRLAMDLLIDLGLRQSEVLSLRWRDVATEDKLLRLMTPKSGHMQTVPLVDTINAKFQALAMATDPGDMSSNELVFGEYKSLQQLWRRVKKSANLPADIRTHDLRRTFGLRISRKHGLHVASKLLRHSNISITEKVYAPLSHQLLLDAVNDQ